MITPRELILRKLDAATAQVKLCAELLNELDGQEQAAPDQGKDNNARAQDEAAPKKKPGKKPGRKPALPEPDTRPKHAAVGGDWEPTASQWQHAEKIARVLSLAGRALSPDDIAAKTAIGQATVSQMLALFGSKAPDGQAWFTSPARGQWATTSVAVRGLASLGK